MFVDQLRHVFVAGGDHHLQALCFGLARQRADDIIGFHARHRQHRPTHQRHQFGQRCRLRAQIIGHGRAVGLVGRVQRMAEIIALGIKYAAGVVVRHIHAQAAQHIEHAVQRAGGHAAGAGKLRHGVIGSV